MGASLCSLHVPSSLVGRAGFGTNTSHAFLQGELAVPTLEGSGPGEGGARTKAMCEVSLPPLPSGCHPLVGAFAITVKKSHRFPSTEFS